MNKIICSGEQINSGFDGRAYPFNASRLIYQVRRHLGITQEDMAGKCGVSKQYISHLENNYYEGIGLTTLQRILENLGYILEVRVVKKAA